MNDRDVPKQRGIYSEILTTEDNENLKNVSTIGPDNQRLIKINKKQKMPRATGIRKTVAEAKMPVVEEGVEGDQVIGKSYFKDPKVNEGFYSKKREGVADVDPKVMEPYVPIPGKPPRKVVIDRQRKLFASLDIEELLLELGIDYKNLEVHQADWLPLEPFDDTEYDCREPQEWISYGQSDDGTQNPIPGKGLFRHEDNSGEWMDVLIHSYDEENQVFCGYWDNSNEYVELTRINLLFNAEDPRIFAQRVAQAHQERIYADSQIRYNFFIDYMPQQELTELDAEQVSRILFMACSSRYLKQNQPETTSILMEVQLDFGRTMNKIIMDKAMEKPENERKDMVPANLTLPPKAPPKEVPYFGMVPIPQHDFPEQFSNFCFNSLYIKDEVIKAMVQIREGCNVLLKEHRIFDVKIKTTKRVEEFKQMQTSNIDQIRFATKAEGWVGHLQKIIKQSFNDVGKGWFNIHERSKETYEFGKLKKFLTLVNFMMQDTVLNMCKESVHEFVEYMLAYIPESTTITSTSEVVNVFKAIKKKDDDEEGQGEGDEASEGSNFSADQNEEDMDEVQKTKAWLKKKHSINSDPEPLFVLDLILRNNSVIPQYSTNPEEIVEKIRQVFEDGVKCLQEIPQLEPLLLRHLFKASTSKTIKAPIIPSEKPIIPDNSTKEGKKTLADENTWLWEAFDKLMTNMKRAIIPLNEYVQTFAAFEYENSLNPDKYIKDIDSGETPISPDELRADIEKKKEAERVLKSKIPEEICVSMFRISCKDIRNAYTGKYASIIDKEIKLIASKAKDKQYEISAQFEEINSRVMQEPKTIEELTQTKKFIMETGIKIESMKKEIDVCMNYYEILDDFEFQLTPQEQKDKWDLYGWPLRLVKQIDTQNQTLEKTKEAFIKKMEEEQEEFEDTLDNLGITIGGFYAFDNLDNYQDIAESVDNVDAKILECIELARTYNQREFLVNKPQKDYSRLTTLSKEFQPYSNLWRTIRNWKKCHKSWMEDPWEQLDAPELDNTFEQSNKVMNSVYRFFRDKEGDELKKIFEIAETMKKQIDAFKPYVPLAVYLRKDGMKDRHWDQISEQVGFDIRPTEDFTLTTVIEKGMLEHVDLCEEVGERAYKEFHIEKSLAKMKADWEDQNFMLPQFKNTSTCYITGFDDAVQMLEEHIVTTQAMQFSPFKKPFEEEIEVWCAKLLLVSDTLEEWVRCQGAWMYLQPIFDSPDIMKQLPLETKRFKSVDSTWKNIIGQAQQDKRILENCSKDGLKERFQDCNSNLDMVQKGLSDYLEKKRSSFARFYFLADDDLLEILSQTKEVRNVRPHLKKVFEAINDLDFKADDSMIAMISAEGERIDFIKKVEPKDRNVEYWMGDVERIMLGSVRNVLLKSIMEYTEQERNEWIKAHAGQVVLNGSQVHWTTDVEEAIAKGVPAVNEYWQFLREQLTKTVNLVRQKLTKLQKVSVNALIVIDVHARDVVEKLVVSNIENVEAFEWISQLRYYWEDEDCRVKCVTTNFPYGYEYLGNTGRLVITPLTDKCYMTLMGALALNLGGAPAGPAGTGKTESTKDLAKALAKQCVVFNCSGSMDQVMVAKFFKGLAASGAWCCFDEFNRINIEVLSVIAQQLLQLFGAKANNDPEINFEESLIKMKPTFCVFITMNPGYAGRTELPDNLKALFRAVAMMVPDYALIGEIMLYSFGFLDGKKLATKMVTTFTLSSEQLSSQDHYDYGMRAVRSVINAAGLLKSEFPDMNEDQLLLRALRDVNVPKFLIDDLPLFENIIDDLFPGVERPTQEYGNLLQSLNESCAKMNLQPTKNFILKVIQLYDTIQVRHGLMLVGPTGGGKTMNYKVLQDAMSALAGEGNFNKVVVDCMNPKSVTMDQLYGYVDSQTQEWQDGVCAKIVQDCSKDEGPDFRWVMFDGPVDALWIENMNTVLDDNKKLCLNSGQMISLTPRMTMMFEVEDLAVASPATVSRCGMVYMEPESLTLVPFYVSWLNTLPPKVSNCKPIVEKFRKLFEDNLVDACYFLRKQMPEIVKTVDNNVAQSCMRIIDCFMATYYESEVKRVSQDAIDQLSSMISPIFFFGMTWSIGCTTNSQGRERFDKWLRDRMKNYKMDFPEERTIYDYCFDTTKQEWVGWFDTVPAYECDTKISYNEIVVPTLDSIRMKYLTKTLVMNNKHCLMPGPTGVGKSVYIQELVTFQMPEEFLCLSITFSAQTSANQTQDYLDDKMEKKRKKVYGPPTGKKYIVFIDDLNMPKKEEYFAQPPLELIRQFLDHQGWFDRKVKEKPFNKLQDIIIVSAMGPPGGGRSVITPRLQRHFNILTYTDISYEAVTTIFTTIGNAFFSTFVDDVKESMDNLVECTVHVYDQILNGPLRPTPNKSHYTFNLRDISRIFQGVVSAHNKYVVSPLDLIRLWIHENQRVFGDRLIDDKDKSWLDSLLMDRAENRFGLKKQQIFNTERLIFGDYLDGIDNDNRIYRQVDNLPKFVELIENYLEDYNSVNKPAMNLVMFLDACDHVSKIHRIIHAPMGNAFLLGVGGSGRQSLSRLATHIAFYKLFQIEVVKGYNMINWREDVKKALLQAGVDNKPTSFLFVDTQIISEQMLEDINNILNSGDVPNLYKQEDMEPITKVGQVLCLEKNIQATKMNTFQQYINRVKKNIHIIVAMSPLGETFRERIRQFPSLVNCCTIDWFSEWPEEALLGVGHGQIVSADLELGKDLKACVEMFKNIHKSVEKKSIQFKDELNRINYVTPTSFLELLNLYKTILSQKRKEVSEAKQRLETGLDVLGKAAVEIAKLKQQIDKAQPILEKTKKTLEQTMIVLSKEKEDADREREIVAKDEAEATEQESEAAALKADAEHQLSKAAPMLDEATRVLKELKKDDFYVISSIKQPTPAIVLGMELSCHMFGHKPSKKNLNKVSNDTHGYFDLSRSTLLQNPGKFMQQMIDFDKENIKESTVKKVNHILDHEDFTLEKVKGASGALVAVQKWASAMMKYHELLKIVNPKRAKVIEMNEKLAVVRAMLKEKRQKLAEVEEKMQRLQNEFDEKKAEETKLVNEIKDAETKLGRANKIISGLEGEKTKWTETVASLADQFSYLIGNCLVAAGMVSYAGAFSAQYRNQLEEEWVKKIDELGIRVSQGMTMKGLLEDPVMTKTWNAAQLPSDNLSIENAIIIFRSRRWPLMIDPQNQANKFIRNLSKDPQIAPQGIEVLKINNPALLRNLELCITNGKWVLIENVGEDLDPALEPILLKQIDKSGTLRLGDKQIPYNQDFKFFLTTTIPNPHYSPETQVKVTILNFAITPFGLEEQMLNQFVAQEMPDQQKKKDMIVQQNAEAARTLREIENKILHGLTKNSDIKDILEDDELIIVLEESKTVSDDINQRLKDSQIVEKDIDRLRETFRPVAFRASILFFAIIDLSVINSMYQYSLQWFANLFSNAIENSPKSNVETTRIKNLNDFFTHLLYENVCRSLFEKDKLLFSFVLCVKILFGDQAMDADEMRYFLAGPSGEIKIEKNPTSFLGDLEWAECYKQIFGMSKLPAFKGIVQDFIKNIKEFEKIYDSDQPHNEPMPGKWDKDLNTFQKMILLKAIRADKISLAIQNFIVEHLGKQFIEPPTFNLAKSFKDSSITIPLIFVLSSGSDPVADFKTFAEEQNMSKKMKLISLGRGQGPKAEALITQGAQSGGWVLLMNCHLATSWMPKLEYIVENLDETNHRDFRLWLTSMPSPSFPVSTLQNSVKMTLEPPSGLKQNCLSTYEAMDIKDFEECTKPEPYKRLLWGFCFFHAIVQDRRKFGPIGWNKAYDFTKEDLDCCRRQLKYFVEQYDSIPYKVLNILGAEINYGGRVTDAIDVRLITTILRTYICPEVMNDGYKFSESGLYYSLPPGEIEDYLDYIKSLPLNPEPEAFGLHSNAEITTSQNATIEILGNVLAMQPRASSGKGQTREEVIGQQAKFLQGKTPEVFDLEMVQKKFPTDYNESMNTVLFQECVRYNRLLSIMKVGLISVQKALVGEVVMSEELEQMATSIFDNQVPGSWQDTGFLSLKPLASWIQDCNDRIDFLQNWINNGTPDVFWISGFFFPQAFITGTLQNFARKYKIAVDLLSFDYVIKDDLSYKDVTAKPEDGVYVYGIYMEGCKWDYEKHMLAESDPKKLFTELPLLHLVPVASRKKPETGIYEFPVYKVLSRLGTLSTTGHSTNFVRWVELPSDQPQDKWIKAGVAGFLALRY